MNNCASGWHAVANAHAVLLRFCVLKSPRRRSAALANIAWAFVTVGQKDAPLFAALATAAERRMGHFNPQNLSNTAWAFATVGHADAKLFTAFAREAEQRVGDITP